MHFVRNFGNFSFSLALAEFLTLSSASYFDLYVQLWTFAYVRLLNKTYENEVTLRGQKIHLKCCQHAELLMYIERGFIFFHTIDIGWVRQRAAKLPTVEL